MPTTQEFILRLVLVVIIGGIIGAEREYQSKSAGFRTLILICLGSFLFTTFGIFISGSTNDRIASNVVTGIGFIGAGVIYQSENRINGITTAATIWATAALGMGIADGAYMFVMIATAVILGSLFLLTRLEKLIDRINQSHTYRIVSDYKEDLLKEYEDLFDECKLKYQRVKRTRRGAHIIGIWNVHGPEKKHNEFTRRILHHPSVKDFEF